MGTVHRPGQGPTAPLSVPAACSPAGKLGQNGIKWAPRETLSKAFLSQRLSAEEGNVMHGICMDGFSTHPSPNLVLSGREEGAGEEATRPGCCQHSSGKGPSGMSTLAEKWGRGMNLRNVAVNETLRFILK